MCPGRRLAEQELLLILAEVIQNYIILQDKYRFLNRRE